MRGGGDLALGGTRGACTGLATVGADSIALVRGVLLPATLDEVAVGGAGVLLASGVMYKIFFQYSAQFCRHRYESVVRPSVSRP